jgi:putative nucleotidyltransferase with HDIG domain
METRRRLGELEAKFLEIVRDWGASIESKDAYTSGHCDRVADLACTLARLAGIDSESLFWFRAGALLHDAGKLIVPSSILNKPGPLNAEERALMERHPAAGEKMLAGIDFPWDVKPMIRHHHERWDGHGYPDQLAGEAIPLSARILCLADVWDALITDRPYRKAFAREKALEIMRKEEGKAFDPRLFQLFLGIVEGGKSPGLPDVRPPIAADAPRTKLAV